MFVLHTRDVYDAQEMVFAEGEYCDDRCVAGQPHCGGYHPGAWAPAAPGVGTAYPQEVAEARAGRMQASGCYDRIWLEPAATPVEVA